MARVLTNENNYYNIADTIRQMKNVNTTYKPREMASALKDIYSNEVEGVPPLSFEANGNNLLNYRIDGNVGGVGDKTNNLFDGIFLHRSVIGANVGTDNVNRRSIAIDISNYNNGEKITFSRETALGSVFQMYQISSIQTGGKLNGENVVSGNSNTLLETITITNVNEYPYLMIFLNGANNPIEDEELIASKIMINVGNTALPYEPYGYKVPVVISGKNLVNKNNMLQGYWAYADGGFAYTSTWICTPKIECSGNTAYTYQFSNTSRWNGFVFYDENGNYISTSNIQNASSTPYRTYTATSPSNARYLVVNIAGFPGIADTISVSDLINFQLEEGSTPTDYEQYIEPTTTNIYLDEPIEENESISLSDANVDIPTIEGTTTLTIDTAIQPSNVYIQAPKDTQEMIEAKSLLQPSLNKFGANISTLNPIIDYSNVINDIYNKLPKITQSGTGLTITPVQNGLLDDFKMIGVDLSQSETPTPDYPQEIKVVEGRQVITDKGKNLFQALTTPSEFYKATYTKINENSFSLNYTQSSTSNFSAFARIDLDISKLKPDTEYTISTSNVIDGVNFSNIGALRTRINGENGSVINSNSLTFTTPNTIENVGIYFYIAYMNTTTGTATITFNNIQVEEGSISTDYEPYYNPVSYNIDLNLENIYLAKMPNTAYKNRIYKNNGNWYYEKNVEKIILDGNATWYKYNNNFCLESITNYNRVTNIPICTHFKGIDMTIGTSISIEDNDKTIRFGNNENASAFRVFIIDSDFSDAGVLKNFLLTHNVELWYILANPVTTQITNTTLIDQLEAISVHTGTNIIELSSDNNMTPQIEITRLKELEKLA